MIKFQILIIIIISIIILCNGQEDISAISCYHCQSDENIDCFENVENIENSVVNCPSDCATGIINETVYRHCRSTLEKIENIENFAICNTTFCNNQPIQKGDTKEELTQNNEIPEIIQDKEQEIFLANEIVQENEFSGILQDKDEEIIQGNEINDENIKVPNEINIEMEKPKIRCYKCKGHDDDCLIITPESELVDCTTSCYTKKSEKFLKRGCISELNDEESKDCSNTKSCNVCTDTECNKESWSKCYTCTSTEDPNCAQWKHSDSNIEVCENSNDSCLIEIVTAMKTVRKCKPINYNCANNEICQKCFGKLCNKGVFPKNRQLCHQCSLTEDCGNEQVPQNMEVCVNYNKNDGCFMYATSDPNLEVLMHRGCKSDVIKYSECQKSETDKRCLTCDNENGCNSQGARTKPKLWCSTCGIDKQCAWSQPPNTLKRCTEYYWYTLKEKCFIYLNNNRTVERGCSFDRGVCIDDIQCISCYTSGCNSGTTIHQSCIQCNSSHVGEIQCRKNLNGIAGKRCKNDNVEFEKIGCYTKIYDKNVIRGCIADLTSNEYQKCVINKDCYTCKDQNCNSKRVYSHGIRLYPKYYILLAVLLIGIKI